MFGPDTVYQHRLALTNLNYGGSNMAKANRRCSVDGCNDKFHARSFCARHNAKFLMYGDPLAGRDGARSGALAQWIENHKGHQGDECLIWPFGRDRNGYGIVNINGVKRVASRVMCRAAHGQPPSENWQAAHSCGKGHDGCMNPKHLRWATVKENSADAVSHGTMKRGDRDPHAKLTETDISEIRSVHGSAHQKILAIKYGVTQSQISRAVTGAEWSWVQGDVPEKRKRGEIASQAKLKHVQVIEILRLKGSKRPVDVATDYGVASRTIRDIWENKTWCHIDRIEQCV